jgi:hypothetical protein
MKSWLHRGSASRLHNRESRATPSRSPFERAVQDGRALSPVRKRQPAALPPHRTASGHPGFFTHALHHPAAAMCLRPNIAQPPQASLAAPWKKLQFAQVCDGLCLG